MKTSSEGLAVLKFFESLQLAAYPDPATGGAPWTIGYGDTGPDVVRGLVITRAQAEMRLANRLAREFEPGVWLALKPDTQAKCTQSQFDALVSFAYNVGVKACAKSTLVRLLNTGAIGQAADQFLVWTLANGKTMRGLVRRRTAERALFLGATAAQALASAALV